MDHFGPAGLAGDEGEAAAGDAEGIGQEGKEGGVGRAVHRRGGEGDFERTAIGAEYAVRGGAGGDLDGEAAAIGGGGEAIVGEGELSRAMSDER